MNDSGGRVLSHHNELVSTCLFFPYNKCSDTVADSFSLFPVESVRKCTEMSGRNSDATYTSTYDDVTQSQRGCKSSTNKHAEINLGLFLTKKHHNISGLLNYGVLSILEMLTEHEL